MPSADTAVDVSALGRNRNVKCIRLLARRSHMASWALKSRSADGGAWQPSFHPQEEIRYRLHDWTQAGDWPWGLSFTTFRSTGGARPHHGCAGRGSIEDDLDELLGYVAAKAKHEEDQPRRKRLDAAFEALTDALEQAGQ